VTFESDRHFIEIEQEKAEKFITILQNQMVELEEINKKLHIVEARYRKQYGGVIHLVYNIKPFLQLPLVKIDIKKLRYIRNVREEYKADLKNLRLGQVPFTVSVKDMITKDELLGINKPFITKTLDSLFGRK